MCNPNALIYQWMVTSANSYWLDFFLRRDCNVLIWNYRGYGRTRGEPDPREFAIDAEQILQYLKLVIGVKGKIGVYGRSLGCIPATHL